MNNGKKIPIARIDTSKKHKFMDKERFAFKDLPKIYIVYHGMLYEYFDGLNRPELFLHYLNRIMQPVIEFNTFEKVAVFFKSAKDHQTFEDFEGPLFKGMPLEQVPINLIYQVYTHKTRVLCSFFGKDEYSEEIQELTDAARRLSYRNNLRVGIVTDTKLVKYLKRNMHTEHLFRGMGYTQCALQRYDDHIEIVDIGGNSERVNFLMWITENSKKKVDVLNSETLSINAELQKSMFLAFVDFDS